MEDDRRRDVALFRYLGLVVAEHDAATRRPISFADLPPDPHHNDESEEDDR